MEDEEEERIQWQLVMLGEFEEVYLQVKKGLEARQMSSTDAHNKIIAKLKDLSSGLLWVQLQGGSRNESPSSSEGQSSTVDASEASHSRRSSSGNGSAVAMPVTSGLSGENSCQEQPQSAISDLTTAVENAILIKNFLAKYNLEEIIKAISAAPRELAAQISNSVERHDSVIDHVLSEEANYANGAEPMAEDGMSIDQNDEVQDANVIPQIIVDSAQSVCPQDINEEPWIADTDTSSGNGINDAVPSFINSNLDSESPMVPDTATGLEFQGIASFEEVDNTPEEPQDVKFVLNFGQTSGRKNIRPINENLRPETAAAVQREEEREARKQERDLQLEGFEHLKEGNPANSKNAVLDYDLFTRKPALFIDAPLVPLLTKYQMEGVQFMWANCYESLVEQAKPDSEGGGCILAHHMGLGKTFQVVSFLHTVLTSPRVRATTALVLSPVSTVENWMMEFDKWLENCSQKIHVYGFSPKRPCLNGRLDVLQNWQRTGGVLILSYGIFRTLNCPKNTLQDLHGTISSALLTPGPDIVVCDEGHILKSCVTMEARLLNKMQTKRRIILTGTPLQNNLMEYYSMVNFVKPNLLGTESEFRNQFDNPIKNGQNRDSTAEDVQLMKTRSHVLLRLLKNCVHRLGYEVLLPLLPAKHEYVIVVHPTLVQRKLNNAYLKIIGDPVARVSAKKYLGDFQQLSKILSHPINLTYEPNSNKKKSASIAPLWWKQCIPTIEELAALENSNKLVLLLDILECSARAGDKVVVFSQYKYTLNIIEDALDKMLSWRKGIEYFRLDGSTYGDDRQKMINEFNSQSCGAKAFLISTQTGGMGINLPSANRVVLFEASMNPAVDMQAVFRTYRLGQTKPCYVYRLIVGGTMEEIVYRNQLKKQSMADRIVDDKNPERHSKEIDFRNMYMPITDESQSAQSVLETSDNVLLVLMANRGEIIQTCLDHKGLVENQEDSGLTAEQRNAAWREYELNRFNTANRVHHLVMRRRGRREVNSVVPGPCTSTGTSDETLTELGERQRRRMSSAEQVQDCGRHNVGNSDCVVLDASRSQPEVITIIDESSDDEIQLLESSDEESTDTWDAANSNKQSFNPVIVSSVTLRENPNSKLINNAIGVIRSTSMQGGSTLNQSLTEETQQLGTPGKSRIVVKLKGKSGSNITPSSSKAETVAKSNSSSSQSKGDVVGARNLLVTDCIPDSPASPDVPQVPIIRSAHISHDGPGTNTLTRGSRAVAGTSAALSRASCESQTELKKRRLSSSRGEPLDHERARARAREVENELASSPHEAHAGTSRSAGDSRSAPPRGRSNERKRNGESRWGAQQAREDPFEFREDSRDGVSHFGAHNSRERLPSQERHGRLAFDGENYYRHEEPSTSRNQINVISTRGHIRDGRGRYQRNTRHRGHYRGRGRARLVNPPEPPAIRPRHRESSRWESDYSHGRNRSSSSRRSNSPQRDRPETRQHGRSYRSRSRSRSRSHGRSPPRYRRPSGGRSPSSRSRRGDMGRSPVRFPSPSPPAAIDLSRVAPPRLALAQLDETHRVENNTDETMYIEARNYNNVQNDHQQHYGDQSSAQFYMY